VASDSNFILTISTIAERTEDVCAKSNSSNIFPNNIEGCCYIEVVNVNTSYNYIEGNLYSCSFKNLNQPSGSYARRWWSKAGSSVPINGYSYHQLSNDPVCVRNGLGFTFATGGGQCPGWYAIHFDLGYFKNNIFVFCSEVTIPFLVQGEPCE
jgi:hypothetical protein